MTPAAVPDEAGPVVVVAELEARAGRREEALAALERVCAATHERDTGCLLYAVHSDVAEPLRLLMVEKWASMADVEAHRGAEHSREFGREESIAVVRVSVLRPEAFGDPGRGAL